MHHGKHNHPCQDGGCPCVDRFAQDLIPDATRALMERLVRARLS